MSKKKAAVAISGGVDSSVAAALLQEQGFNVIGVTMLVNPYSDNNLLVKKARSVCNYIGIPLYTADLREKFKKSVIESFAYEYYKGRTPNPCVVCNPIIKFGHLMKYAQELGADYFATGHYARVKFNKITEQFELLRGINHSKDQAYALYRLSQSQLGKIIFPLGALSKEEVKAKAAKLGLPSAVAEESQEICFIDDNNYARFLQENFPADSPPGDILSLKGEVIGRHKGLIHYTVGQRRGLGISHPEPLYVVKINLERNALIVGHQEDLFSKTAKVTRLSWISGRPPADNKVLCKIRYKHEVSPAFIILNHSNDSVQVKFEAPQRAITPGQSAVFYTYPDGEVVLGGGIIQ